jgi:uncharacterized OsmC-like protein
VMYAWATSGKQNADDLVIDVSWKFSSDEPHRVSELNMTYRWPSLPAKKHEAAKRVAQLCTIHATLHDPPATTIEAEAAGSHPAQREGSAVSVNP